MTAGAIDLLVGLGNPGSKYECTRHNAGFMVVDEFVASEGGGQWQRKNGAEFIRTSAVPLPVLKPMEFMNVSGKSVGAFARFWKIDPLRVLVVHDEIDLPFGRIQIKKGGGEGGHNGLRSLSSHLGTKDYVRLRVGVGRPANPRMDVASWVLQRFSTEELQMFPAVADRCRAAIRHLSEGDIRSGQNLFNG